MDDLVLTCRNCNKRRCRYRLNLPKRKTKKQLLHEEMMSRFVQLDLFDELLISYYCEQE
jgi:hypothetical protein